MDIESRIRDGRMTAFQLMTVALCILATLSDGYDIIAISLAGPPLREEWGVDPVAYGYLLSAAIAGMVVGAVLIAPLADRFGRRRLAITGQALITLGMAMAWLAPGYHLMLAGRFVTGIGIGTITAVMGVLVAEYSSRRWHGFMMAMFSTGLGLGGFLGGLIGMRLIPTAGWQSMFLLGAVINVVILALCVALLPESLQFLATSRRRDALTTLNRLLVRMHREPIDQLSATPAEQYTSMRQTARSMLSTELLLVTVLLAVGYCILNATLYVNIGWTPDLITTATEDTELGLTFGTLAPLGGAIGGLLYAVVSLRVRSHPLTVAALALGAGGAALLGVTLLRGETILIVPLTMSIGFGAAIAGYYALIPAAYPTRIRSSAFGLHIGLGRLAATLGPSVTGHLVAAGWGASSVFLAIAALLAVALIALLPIRAAIRRGPDALPSSTAEPASATVIERSTP